MRLVHPDQDFTCRRCHVDLLTGEAVKPQVPVKLAKPAFEMKSLKAKAWREPSRQPGQNPGENYRPDPEKIVEETG